VRLALLIGCGAATDKGGPQLRAAGETRRAYNLQRVIEVEGRQGVATDGERYFVSGSTVLFVYSIELP